jgi:hypothetical protein
MNATGKARVGNSGTGIWLFSPCPFPEQFVESNPSSVIKFAARNGCHAGKEQYDNYSMSQNFLHVDGPRWYS